MVSPTARPARASRAPGVEFRVSLKLCRTRSHLEPHGRGSGPRITFDLPAHFSGNTSPA